MPSVGNVREWDADEGWGVIDSADTPGGCWAHFSAVAATGYAAFPAGAEVHFEWKAPGQEGYPFRAVRVWAADSEPADRPSAPAPSAAYRSTLTLTFDEPQLQLHEIVRLTYDSLSCTVRCIAGPVQLGDTVQLIPFGADRPIAEGLTISAIEFAGGIPMDFVDVGRTALVTVTGHINQAALRAAAPENTPEHVIPADLRLIVR